MAAHLVVLKVSSMVNEMVGKMAVETAALMAAQ